MKSKRIFAWLTMLCLALTLTACTSEPENEAALNGFSCYTADQRGEKLNGFEKEADGRWYLFIPSAQSLPDVVLHYTGDVIGSSGGMLDPNKRTVSNAFSASGDTVELTTAEGEVITVAAMQSGLPSVQIYLAGTDLDTIHQDKDAKYYKNTFVLTDPDGAYNLTAENNVQIKGRGNTTWKLYEKKGYQIKFSVPTSVLGMDKAQKWVLMANASDDSMMRTQLVYRMADKLDMPFVSSMEYVDLWIDGTYLGTYLLGEKVEIGSSRLDLKQPNGALMEHDEGYYKQEQYWLYNTLLKRHFALKEIAVEEDAFISEAMDYFNAALQKLMAFLYTAPSEEVTLDALSAMIDVDSFAKYYLVNEYALNCESFATSFYWYMDGPEDVIHLGPLWDFDTCMGNDGMDYTQSYGDNHVLFKYLLASPEFRGRTEELYAQYKDAFAAMAEDADVLRNEIRESAQMNYLRWDVLGTPGVKKDAEAFHDTFDEAVDEVQRWLRGREENFQIADCERIQREQIYTGISEDQCTMLIFFPDEQIHEKVDFAVWNLDSDGGVVLWDTAEQVDGAWYGEVDLRIFNSAGTYSIHAYVDGGQDTYATGRSYVKQAAESVYQVDTRLSDDGKLTITLQDLEPCSGITFAVWSDLNGQDDIQWFDAARNSQGLWEYTADLESFADRGKFYIHSFKNEDGIRTICNASTFVVPDAE